MSLIVVTFNLVGCDKESKQRQEKANAVYGTVLEPMEIPDTGKVYVPLGQKASDAPETKVNK